MKTFTLVDSVTKNTFVDYRDGMKLCYLFNELEAANNLARSLSQQGIDVTEVTALRTWLTARKCDGLTHVVEYRGGFTSLQRIDECVSLHMP